MDKETQVFILAQEVDVLEEIINIIRTKDSKAKEKVSKVEKYVLLQLKNHKDQIDVLKKELSTDGESENR
ncbi:MAG: hypothetical protein IJE05_01705 [Clostridia bacterium]|nr:hypothetical protein [Clostridia bacterium]